MPLPEKKTKIVATIGPASSSPEVLARMIEAGLDVARLNFSHGEFTAHGQTIDNIREAEQTAGRAVTIMADLPGPKMRLGKIDPEPISLAVDDRFVLTTDKIVGDKHRVSMTFDDLPKVVRKGDRLYLNDGIVQLVVENVTATDVECVVAVGGELRSKKGLNLPGIKLGISAFTERDRACLEFALSQGVEAVSQSFVETAKDIHAVRDAAKRVGKRPFIIAKIERAGALSHMEEILGAADGIMVARGDLGIEVPIREVALIQKRLIAMANLVGKPVITATQMLESMVSSKLPTRAEASDVANAVLDGTDCVMLSAESAMGRYPVESVATLASIAQLTEEKRPTRRYIDRRERKIRTSAGAISSVVEHALQAVPSTAVVVPTVNGEVARMISRFKPNVFIVAASTDEQVCRGLGFSYGVLPVLLDREPEDWSEFSLDWVKKQNLEGQVVMLVGGPSKADPHANYRLEFLSTTERAATSAEEAQELGSVDLSYATEITFT